MSEISSGLVVSIYLAFSDDGENIRFWTSNAFRAVEWAQENWETEAFVRLSDAEAIISAKDAEIAESDHIRDRCAHLLAETAVALKGPEKALHRHGWQDLPEVAAKQSAALKLAREALFDMQDSYAAVHGWKDSFVIAATTALAAIDNALGEAE